MDKDSDYCGPSERWAPERTDCYMENTYKLEYVFGILTIKKEEKEQQD
jgi:hypothetical protein